MIVSNAEPIVSIVTVPEAGAVHANQIEWPPALPAWVGAAPPGGGVHATQLDCPPALPAGFGSPASFVAPTFEPVVLPDAAETAWALANMSFAGALDELAIVHVWLAGVWSVLPAASVAR